MAKQMHRYTRQASWSALAALVVASVATPVHQAPAVAQANPHVAAPAITQAAPGMAAKSGTSQDIVHRYPWP